MSGEGAPATGGSDVGSPAAGAVTPRAPQRMSDLGVGGQQGSGGRMSDLGTPSAQGAARPGEKMTPLSPFGDNDSMFQALSEPKQPDAEPVVEPDVELEQTPAEEQQEPDPNQPLTPEQQAAKYNEWMNSDQIPEEFLDRPIWVPDGKDGHVPVRLRDIHNNVLLYNDYQRKTTVLAEGNRQVEAFKAGRQNWVNDMTSGDPERGLRAIRGVGAEKCLEAIVVKFVQNMAALEGLSPQMQAQFLAGQKAQDRAYFAEQRLQQIQQEQERARLQAEQQQGTNAPDITYVQDSINAALPAIYKELNVQDSPAMDHILSSMLAEAAQGVRDPQTGQWITPPTIQLGRAPTKQLLTQIVLAAKQRADTWAVPQGKPIKAPPTKPLQQSGPAAKPGQRGNISTPPRQRFSDLAPGGRPR